jgi:hypothetical protein
MVKDNMLPDIWFGQPGERGVNWRDLPEEPDPDDEELEETPADVVLLLGFDPKEFSQVEKQVGILSVLKGGEGSGSWNGPGDPRFAHEIDSALNLVHRYTKDNGKEFGMLLIDGKWKGFKGTDRQVSYKGEDWYAASHAIHSHPDSSSFSGQDVSSFMNSMQMRTADVVAADGTVYRLEKGANWKEKNTSDAETAGLQVTLYKKLMAADALQGYSKEKLAKLNMDEMTKIVTTRAVEHCAKNWGLDFKVLPLPKKESKKAFADIVQDEQGGGVVIDDGELFEFREWLILEIKNRLKDSEQKQAGILSVLKGGAGSGNYDGPGQPRFPRGETGSVFHGTTADVGKLIAKEGLKGNGGLSGYGVYAARTFVEALSFGYDKAKMKYQCDVALAVCDPKAFTSQSSGEIHLSKTDNVPPDKIKRVEFYKYKDADVYFKKVQKVGWDRAAEEVKRPVPYKTIGIKEKQIDGEVYVCFVFVNEEE